MEHPRLCKSNEVLAGGQALISKLSSLSFSLAGLLSPKIHCFPQIFPDQSCVDKSMRPWFSACVSVVHISNSNGDDRDRHEGEEN